MLNDVKSCQKQLFFFSAFSSKFNFPCGHLIKEHWFLIEMHLKWQTKCKMEIQINVKLILYWLALLSVIKRKVEANSLCQRECGIWHRYHRNLRNDTSIIFHLKTNKRDSKYENRWKSNSNKAHLWHPGSFMLGFLAFKLSHIYLYGISRFIVAPQGSQTMRERKMLWI